jgi:hypothetical protein
MIARNQARYARLGISAELVRLMHRESKLTADERQTKYADELRYRRAVSLWEADSEEDFDRAMQQASETAVAGVKAQERLAAARAYNDGFNSMVQSKGKSTAADNPNEPGTIGHAEWTKGHRDGGRHLKALGDTVAEEPAAEADAPKKNKGGRPRLVKEGDGLLGTPSIPH